MTDVIANHEVVNLSNEKPEVIAEAMARLSRSGKHIKELVETSKENAGKVAGSTVAWAHDSVAELAHTSFVVHGASMLLAEELVDSKRVVASVSSTRYQVLDETNFVWPFAAGEVPVYLREHVVDTYKRFAHALKVLTEHAEKIIPEDTPMRKSVVKARALDSARYWLPCGQGTNVGVVYNSRDARDMISRLSTSNIAEYRAVAPQIHRAVEEDAPTFVNKYLKLRRDEAVIADGLWKETDIYCAAKEGHATLSRWDLDIKAKARSQGMDLDALLAYVEGWSSPTKGKAKSPLLESVSNLGQVSFDMVLDFGAWRDLHRQRRCNRYLVGGMTPDFSHGFAKPPQDVFDTDLYDMYVDFMEATREVYQDTLVYGKDVAAYFLPLGVNVKAMMSMDIGQWAYVGNLRTGEGCHESYRNIAAHMVMEVIQEAKEYGRGSEFNHEFVSNLVGKHVVERCEKVLAGEVQSLHK